MRYFTVTAVVSVALPYESTTALVKNEAETLLRNTIDRRSHGYGAGSADASITLGSVTVEEAPEPEPTITLTKSELDKVVADCVAEALAAANVATTPAE